MKNKNVLVLISPSASGKSVQERLLEKIGFHRVVSTTTRNIRDGEIDGISYNFISVDEFKKKLDNKEFLEFTKFDDNYYGAEYSQFKDKNNIFVADIEGLLQIKEAGFNVTSFYLDVPEEIRFQRMIKRGDDFQKALKRLAHDKKEFENVTNLVDNIIDGTKSSERIHNRIIELFNFNR